jgi:hypothetical protein
MIFFHGGFHFGGTLTRVLMWLLIITVFSGVFGAVLQHYVPRVMTSDVPLETIYDEIGNVRLPPRPFRCAPQPPSARARAPPWLRLPKLFC